MSALFHRCAKCGNEHADGNWLWCDDCAIWTPDGFCPLRLWLKGFDNGSMAVGDVLGACAAALLFSRGAA